MSILSIIVLMYIIIGCIYCGVFCYAVNKLGQNWQEEKGKVDDIRKRAGVPGNIEDFGKALSKINVLQLIVITLLWPQALLTYIKMKRGDKKP